jgi:hypothetical protein
MLASASVSSPTRFDGGHYVTLSRPLELAQRLAAYVARIP